MTDCGTPAAPKEGYACPAPVIEVTKDDAGPKIESGVPYEGTFFKEKMIKMESGQVCLVEVKGNFETFVDADGNEGSENGYW